MLKNFTSGYNGCFMAYGQTGTGKTYTMLGDDQKKGSIFTKIFSWVYFDFVLCFFFKNLAKGFIDFFAEELFQKIESEFADDKCELTMSLTEVYMDKVYDLQSGKEENLNIKREIEGNFYGLNLKEIEILNNLKNILFI